MKSRRSTTLIAEAAAASSTTTTASAAAAHTVTAASSLSSSPDVSGMDPWKDDRCRDFVVLNTIQQLRAYHLPRGEPMPIVEPVNLVRSRNLVMLPRATPDYRPCCKEQRPTKAELRERRRQQRRAKRRERRRNRERDGEAEKRNSGTVEITDEEDEGESSPSSSAASSSSVSTGRSSPHASITPSPERLHQDETHELLLTTADTTVAKTAMATSPRTPAAPKSAAPSASTLCAIDRARALFFGSQAFTSSTSPRRLVAALNVPLTPSPATLGRKGRRRESISLEGGLCVAAATAGMTPTCDTVGLRGASGEGATDASIPPTVVELFPSAIARRETGSEVVKEREGEKPLVKRECIDPEIDSRPTPLRQSLRDDLTTFFLTSAKAEKEEQLNDTRAHVATSPKAPLVDILNNSGSNAETGGQQSVPFTEHSKSPFPKRSSDDCNHVGDAMADAVRAAQHTTHPTAGYASHESKQNSKDGHSSDTASTNESAKGQEQRQDNPQEDVAYAPCDVTAVLLAHFQSLLTRGVVLDKLNHKELGFAWWIVGKGMCISALDEVGRPQRREALLITLRNFYYGLLSDSRRRVPATTAVSESATDASATTVGAGGGDARSATATVETGATPASGGGSDTSAGADTPPAPATRPRRAALEKAKAALGSGPFAEWSGMATATARSEGGRIQVSDATAATGGGGRGTVLREDSPDPQPQLQYTSERNGNADAGDGDHAARTHPRSSGGDRTDGDDGEGVDTNREDGLPRSSGETAATVVTTETSPTLPGRGRTHGTQGKAAARRKTVDVIWRPLRESTRRGASVSAVASEESSMLAPPSSLTTVSLGNFEGAGGTAPRAESDTPSGGGGGGTNTAANTAAVTGQRRCKLTARTTAAAPTASREPSVPQDIPETTASTGGARGRKRARAGITRAPVPAPAAVATVAAAAAPLAATTEESVTSSSTAPTATECTPTTNATAVCAAPAAPTVARPPAAPSPQPTEEDTLAALAGAFALSPSPRQLAVVQRVTRRMAAGTRRHTLSISSHTTHAMTTATISATPTPTANAKEASECGRGACGGGNVSTLSAQTSYRFLLSSSANLPESPLPSVKAKRRAGAAAAIPWESAATTAATGLTRTGAAASHTSATAATPAVASDPSVEQPAMEHSSVDAEHVEKRFKGAGGAEDNSLGRGRSSDNAATAAAPMQWERYGRKRLRVVPDEDANGAVAPVLRQRVVRHDQAAVEALIAARRAAAAVAAAETASGVALRPEAEGGEAGWVTNREIKRHLKAATEELPLRTVKRERSADDSEEEPLSTATPAAASCVSYERRVALLSRPFPTMPYALRCLLTWEAGELLRAHRTRLERRQRRRQQASRLLRAHRPMTRRMAALAARGELPSTSSGSSAASRSDDDEDYCDSDDSDERGDCTSGSDSERGGSMECSDGTHDGSVSSGREAEEARGEERDKGSHLRLPRQLYDYWAEYRTA